MANVEHINRVIASIRGEQAEIRALGVGFNMSGFIEAANDDDRGPNNCGTVACIAGHAYIQSCFDKGEEPDLQAKFQIIEVTASEYLGITSEQGSDLFVPALSLTYITLNDAVEVLNVLRDEDIVDWHDCDDWNDSEDWNDEDDNNGE